MTLDLGVMRKTHLGVCEDSNDSILSSSKEAWTTSPFAVRLKIDGILRNKVDKVDCFIWKNICSYVCPSECQEKHITKEKILLTRALIKFTTPQFQSTSNTPANSKFIFFFELFVGWRVEEKLSAFNGWLQMISGPG